EPKPLLGRRVPGDDQPARDAGDGDRKRFQQRVDHRANGSRRSRFEVRLDREEHIVHLCLHIGRDRSVSKASDRRKREFLNEGLRKIQAAAAATTCASRKSRKALTSARASRPGGITREYR